MKNKLLFLCIFFVFMLVTISIVSAINIQKNYDSKTNESPLYGIRTKITIKEKIDNLKSRFIVTRNRLVLCPEILDNLFSKDLLNNRIYNYRSECCSMFGICNNPQEDNILDNFNSKTDGRGPTCYDTCAGGGGGISCYWTCIIRCNTSKQHCND